MFMNWWFYFLIIDSYEHFKRKNYFQLKIIVFCSLQLELYMSLESGMIIAISYDVNIGLIISRTLLVRFIRMKVLVEEALSSD